MKNWKMLTLVGKDQPGIVARVTGILYKAGAELGEASMMRLGDHFTIMLMVNSSKTVSELNDLVAPAAEEMKLTVTFLPIETKLHQHEIPDYRITVYCADAPGIVSKTTGYLLEAGFNIMDLESDVAGTEDKPIYIMYIEGKSSQDEDAMRQAVEKIKSEGIDVDFHTIETMIA